jgi:hypothetical protein
MKSGYSGHDSMRENAERALGSAVRDVSKKAKSSASSPEKLKPRLYKKGGHVKHENMHEHHMKRKMHEKHEHHKHHMKSMKTKKMAMGGEMYPGESNGGFENQVIRGQSTSSPGIGGYKKGGKVKKCSSGGGMTHFKMAGEPGYSEGHMKKGGKVKKMFMGGIMTNPLTSQIESALNARKSAAVQTPPQANNQTVDPQVITNALKNVNHPFGMKRGGKVKKCSSGGGMTHFKMAGEPGYSEGHMKKGGKVKKMAMGGVGKIRHDQYTYKGKKLKNGII